MGTSKISSSVITSTGDGADAVDEAEVVYYTVRGRRRRRRGQPASDMFRKLQVWYGTIDDPEPMSAAAVEDDLDEVEIEVVVEAEDDLDVEIEVVEAGDEGMETTPLPIPVAGLDDYSEAEDTVPVTRFELAIGGVAA